MLQYYGDHSLPGVTFLEDTTSSCIVHHRAADWAGGYSARHCAMLCIETFRPSLISRSISNDLEGQGPSTNVRIYCDGFTLELRQPVLPNQRKISPAGRILAWYGTRPDVRHGC